jgi:hypothetical protein
LISRKKSSTQCLEMSVRRLRMSAADRRAGGFSFCTPFESGSAEDMDEMRIMTAGARDRPFARAQRAGDRQPGDLPSPDRATAIFPA